MSKPTLLQDNFRKNSKFNGGSRLVLGTSGLGGIWGKVDEIESVDAILYALEHGVEVLDTAPSYYKAEEYLGKALNRWKGPRPFLSTKIGRLKAEQPDELYLDYTPEGLRKSLMESMNLLGVDFLDLLFLHEPQLVPVERMDSIMDTLHSFQQEGMVGMLGIGGNPVGKFWAYVTRDYFDVVSSFLKMDACTLEGFTHDIPRFLNEDLAIYAASSLHMGLLGSNYETLKTNPPNNEWIQPVHVENAERVCKIAHENEMTLSELSLRYLYSMKEAGRVVLGPKNLDEVKESLHCWEKGLLSREVFNRVTEVLLNSMD